MKKKILLILLTISLVTSSLFFTFNAFADDVDWHYDDSNHTLYITGTGEMDNYENEYSIPWSEYAGSIEKVIIESGITSVGDYSFVGLKELSSVDIPDSVTSIGANAFDFCPMLKELSLGKNITSIADTSFASVGETKKTDFSLIADAGTFAYSFCFDNSVPILCPSIECSDYDVSIYVGSMNAVYPFTPKYDGKYKFYSSGVWDTKGYLYDSSHELLAYNDTSSLPNDNFLITYELEKGKTYYISISLFTKGIKGNFKLSIEAENFTYSGTVNAMLLPDGTPSDIILTDALVDGVPAGSSFTVEITGGSKSVEFCYNGQSKIVELNANSEPITAFVVCDVNNDGYVNAKDYAIMYQSSSPFIDLFGNFINFDFN